MTGLSLELSNYYEEKEWPMIRHPLVYAVPFFDTREEIVRLNKMLDHKKEAVIEAESNHNWGRYIFLYERPWRLHAFKQINASMDDSDYWKLLAEVWIDCENIREHRMDWWEMLTSTRRKRKMFMDTSDRCTFRKLPVQIEAYRGTREIEKDSHYFGFSWTLNREKADWFAKRFVHRDDGGPVVCIAQFDRNLCVGYLNGRGEEELVATEVAFIEGRWETL